MVQRILRAMFKVGMFDPTIQAIIPIDAAANEAIAQETEEQGAVLLKNAGGQLPLTAANLRSIAVIGMHADGWVLSGGGSAQVQPRGGGMNEGQPNPPGWASVIWDPSSPLEAIRAKAPNANVRFDAGTNAASAASLAASSDVAIVFASQWESEGMDLPALDIMDLIHSQPLDQNALVAAVAAANPRTIVVVQSGGAQAMPWLGNVAAVLEAWYPGLRGGPAIANLLFGAVNPSGKLPITFPASAFDLPRPTIPHGPNSVTPFPLRYTEGFNVGYKWFDAQNLTPLFPFGFGLSYTTFSISGARLADNLKTSTPNFQVTFDVTNTGAAAGAEVAQVYLGLPASTGEAPRRLVGWRKVFLQPGATAAVTVRVDENDSSHPLSYWDPAAHKWTTAPGDYTVYLGTSSRVSDLSVVGTLRVGL
jgi:beta-glucosidase